MLRLMELPRRTKLEADLANGSASGASFCPSSSLSSKKSCGASTCSALMMMLNKDISTENSARPSNGSLYMSHRALLASCVM